MRLIYFVVLNCIVALSFAQDPHFSQLNNSGIYLNPAIGGVFDGRARYTLNYHDQWSSVIQSAPYRTVSLSAELKYQAINEDFFALHLNTHYDQVGASRFSQANFQLGGSYIKKIGGGYNSEQYLSLGGQIGVGQNTIDANGLWYGRQFNIETGARDLDSGENFTGTSSSDLYFSGNLGLFYYSVMDENKSFYAGLAAHHFNEPNISLGVLVDGPAATLDRRLTINAGGELPISNSTSLLPSAVFLFQGPSRQLNLGSTLRFAGLNNDELALRAGLYLRATNSINSSIATEALIVLFGLEQNNWMANISYDITVSSLRSFNDGRGAFELSFIYINPFDKKKGSVNCPKL